MITQEQFDYVQSIRNLLIDSLHLTMSYDVATFIACQFALESSFGQSHLAITCNNHCGMRYPHSRLSSSIHKDVHSGFASYSSFLDCVFDYVLCIQYHKPLRCELYELPRFKNFIKWYCPEIDYIARIERIYNQFTNLKS